jgi:hypothetical protein
MVLASRTGVKSAILNLEYGYRYRRKGANLSDINCFRVEEIEMSEKLSFDWFIAKIHEVFGRLPDYRKFSPNLRYSVKEAVLLKVYRLTAFERQFFGYL